MSEDVAYTSRLFRIVRKSYLDQQGREHVRDTVQHPGAVAIVPLLPGDRVCLIRNYRVAVDATLIEVPAGTLEPGEDPDHTAVRELEEETGYRAARIERVCEFYNSPGFVNERMYLYVAQDLTPGPTALEAGEEIETLIVPWAEALEMIRDGRIQDAKTIVGLLHWELLRPR